MASISPAFRYTALDGETVSIPRLVEPYKFLNVNQNASREEIKKAFRRVADDSSRQVRAMASLSYLFLMSTDQRYRKINNDSYEVSRESDVIVLAAVGYTDGLINKIFERPSLVTSTDEHEQSLLYVTARAGFYDTTKALLKIGVPVNETQVDGSTALHAASFYGQQPVVELLLRHGADPTVTNKWGNSPADEANSREIKQIILSYKKDRISQILTSLVREDLAHMVRFIKHDGTVIAKEVLRRRSAIDRKTRERLPSIISTWKNVWHGTRAEHLESIMRHGLKPSGSMLPDGRSISPPSGHFKLGEKYFGISDWARAIFVSPRITYASHKAYSEPIVSDNKQWRILIRARVKPNSYTRHKSTVTGADPLAGESELPEYRVANSKAAGMFSQANSEEEAEIFGILSETETVTEREIDRNVVVTSVVFISEAFLNETDRTFQEVMSLFDKEHFS